MSARREYVLVLLGLLVGAALSLWAGAQRWYDAPGATLLGGTSGRQVAPAAFTLGLVGLAGAIATLATRALGRRVVGALIGLAGLGIVVSSVVAAEPRTGAITAYGLAVHLTATPWRFVSVAGGVLLVLGGLAVVVRAGRWPATGSRYDAPAARGARGPVAGSAPATATNPPGSDPPGHSGADDPWARLDRGEDPTDPTDPTDSTDPEPDASTTGTTMGRSADGSGHTP